MTNRTETFIVHGARHRLARAAGINPSMLSACLAGKKSYAAPLAERMASLTGTEARIWLQGGTAGERQAALRKWTLDNR
jgi:plasmid maintenance system antidote protein VapI